MMYQVYSYTFICLCSNLMTSAMPKTRLQTRLMEEIQEKYSKDYPITASPRKTLLLRIAAPITIDQTDHRPLHEIIHDHKNSFVPAETCAHMSIQSDVHGAVYDVIRHGDFRILTRQLIYQQACRMVPRESIVQYASYIDQYITTKVTCMIVFFLLQIKVN